MEKSKCITSKKYKLLEVIHYIISLFAAVTSVIFLFTNTISVGEVIVYLCFFAVVAVSVWYMVVGCKGTDKGLGYVTSAYALYIMVSFAVGSIILSNSTSLVLACNFLSFGLIGAISGMLGDGKLNSREAKICWVLLGVNLALELFIAVSDFKLSGLSFSPSNHGLFINIINIVQIFERVLISVTTIICFIARAYNKVNKTPETEAKNG